VIVGHDQTRRRADRRALSPSRKSRQLDRHSQLGELDRQHLTAAVPIDADRNQHRLADNHPCLAHPLIARVEDQIGEGFGQAAAANCASLSQSRAADFEKREKRRALTIREGNSPKRRSIMMVVDKSTPFAVNCYSSLTSLSG
jgi:hypothetical protein